MVEKARIMKGWAIIRVAMKSRLRERGSCWRWFWLAIIISGKSQQDRVRRGDESWSMPIH